MQAGAPVKFSQQENLLWKVKLPGRGCSTPVVVDGKIFVTTPIDGEDGVVAYDFQGKELWRKKFGKLEPGRGQRVGSSSNSSPLCDGELVFVFFKSGHLAALSLDGEERWSMNLFEKYGENKLWWDVGTSPVIAGGNLVVAMMQTDAPSYIVSLDRKTGQEVWKIGRKYETGAESGDSYTTPLVLTIDGRETLVLWGADHLSGHDVDSGKMLWSCGGFNPKKLKAWRVIASAVETDGVVVVPYGRGEYMAGIRPGGSGDITATARLWSKKGLGADSSTPVAKDGLIYLLIDSGRKRGRVTCLDAVSGEVKWETKLPKAPQIYYASPVLSGDRIYCVREDGMVFSGKLTPNGLEDVVANEIGEGVIASPVVVDGKLLLRGDVSLMCFGK